MQIKIIKQISNIIIGKLKVREKQSTKQLFYSKERFQQPANQQHHGK